MSKEFEDLLGQYWDLAHLEGKSGVSQGDKANKVLHALKKLAEQPAQQEPVAWTLTKTLTERETTTRGYLWFSDPQNCMWTPLYTSPPAQRKPWVGLTEQEAAECWSTSTVRTWQAIEAKLKEKNA